MKQPVKTSQSSPKTPSLADTLSAGFGVFLRRPWVLLVPLLVDVWLRWGVRITPYPIGNWLRQLGTRFDALDQAALQPLATSLDAADVRTVGLATQLFPSLLRASNHPSTSGMVWSPPNIWVLVLIVIGLNIVALLLSSLMLVPLAQAVRGQPTSRTTLRSIVRVWWRLGQYIGLLLAAGLLLTVPAVLTMLLLTAAVPFVAQLIVVLWVTLLIIFWFFTSFGIEAIVVGEVTPSVAVYQSYNIVRRWWRESALLLAALFIVAEGATLALVPLLTTPLSVVGVCAVYGIVSGTLSAARMVFYQHAVAQLTTAQPKTLATSQ